jgi:hypothetical protein
MKLLDLTKVIETIEDDQLVIFQEGKIGLDSEVEMFIGEEGDMGVKYIDWKRDVVWI